MSVSMIVHGLNLHADDWRERVFGVPPHRLGRASRAIHLFSEMPDVSDILFGSGASTKDGLKECDYTIKFMLDHFDELIEFEVFDHYGKLALWQLKQKFERVALGEQLATNTFTELKIGIPRLFAGGSRRIILISDLAHISRCLAHGGQVLEELNLEGKVELVAEHSFYRNPLQKLSEVVVFEPESAPAEDIQLGSMAKQLFGIPKGKRREFADKFTALMEEIKK